MIYIQKNSSHKGRFSPPRMLLILAQGKEAPEADLCGFWAFSQVILLFAFLLIYIYNNNDNNNNNNNTDNNNYIYI